MSQDNGKSGHPLSDQGRSPIGHAAPFANGAQASQNKKDLLKAGVNRRMQGVAFGTQLPPSANSQIRHPGYASTINFAMGNIRDDDNRLNINSMDGETPQDMMERFQGAEDEFLDGDANMGYVDGEDGDFKQGLKQTANYMRNTKSREIQLAETTSKRLKAFTDAQKDAQKRPGLGMVNSPSSVLSHENNRNQRARDN